MKENMQSLSFWVRLLKEYIYCFLVYSASFKFCFFLVTQNSLLHMWHTFIIQSFTDRHQDWFHFPVIVNRAGVYGCSVISVVDYRDFWLYCWELYSWVMRCFYL